jgi:hypothetical protein
VKTDELIVRLAASAHPVRVLPSPARRLGRWLAAALAVTILGVAIIGTRPDIGDAAGRAPFLAVAALTMATALAAAAAAFVLSVPGLERSAMQRWAAVGAGAAWAGLLTAGLTSGESPIQRLAAFPIHAACVAQIVLIAAIPAWLLLAMLRQAASLRHGWSAGLATLAAVALAAAGTQFICPVDDPAHHLIGHVGPVAALAALGTFLGARAFTTARIAES